MKRSFRNVALATVGILALMTTFAAADLLTRGKLFLSADKATYIGYESGTLTIVIDNTTMVTATSSGLTFNVTPTATTLAATTGNITTGNITTVNSTDLLAAAGAGTVTTSGTTVAEEHGDSVWHYTTLTLTAFAVGTSGDAEALALGASLYTFPAGNIAVDGSSIVGAVTAAISATSDTPELCLGTATGTGAQATCGAVSAAVESIGGPFVLTNVAGDTATDGGVGATSNTVGLLVPTAGSHVVYLNVADTWADVTAAGAVTFTGVVTIKWRVI